jgi:hemolysin activation/secretion protein
LPDFARPGAVRPQQEDKLELPKSPPSEVMEVPAVIDRPFDVDECPCTIVTQFRLLNAEDMPDYGVSVAEVQAILDESIRQQAAEGLSIGQLQEVVNVARKYYRQKGLILTQIVIPVQTVQGGVVDLELYVGKLGRVLTENNKIYSAETLEMAFGNLIGKPIHKGDVEAALLRLTDFPGLTVFGVFQPGQSVGTADLVLKVQKEARFDVAMRVDNHGTRETGQYRFRTIIDWNNPTDGADKLTLSVEQSYHPKNTLFKGVDYKRYLGDGSYTMNAFLNTNEFDVGGDFASFNIHAKSENLGLWFDKSFIRSRLKNISAKIGFTKKKSETTTDGNPTNEDRLSVFLLGINYDSVDTMNPFNYEHGGGGINFATLELSQGVNNFFDSMGSNSDAQKKPVTQQPSRRGGSGELAEGQFTKLFGTFTRLQTVQQYVSLLFRAEFQWSDDLLVPLEQYSVGGPDNVRAFPVAQVLWDKALFYSFEFLINAPFIADQIAFENRTWGELLQLGIFYDYAIGKVNDPTVIDQDGYQGMKGAGVGMRFNVPGAIESRIFWAWELGGEDIGNDKRPQFWGDFTYSF